MKQWKENIYKALSGELPDTLKGGDNKLKTASDIIEEQKKYDTSQEDISQPLRKGYMK